MSILAWFLFSACYVISLADKSNSHEVDLYEVNNPKDFDTIVKMLSDCKNSTDNVLFDDLSF